MLRTITDDLARATIAGWYARLAGSSCPQRNHWQTKTMYYRAVAELLAAQPDRPLTWKTIVGAAHGRRSTFYEVAGQHARHGMVRELIDDGSVRSHEIALRYGRTSPVELLIDEAKVWSFWPYRQHFVAQSPGLDGLRDAVVTWSRLNPALAAANAFRPPACTVEDLVLLYEGRLAASRAESRLAELIRHTLSV